MADDANLIDPAALAQKIKELAESKDDFRKLTEYLNTIKDVSGKNIKEYLDLIKQGVSGQADLAAQALKVAQKIGNDASKIIGNIYDSMSTDGLKLVSHTIDGITSQLGKLDEITGNKLMNIGIEPKSLAKITNSLSELVKDPKTLEIGLNTAGIELAAGAINPLANEIGKVEKSLFGARNELNKLSSELMNPFAILSSSAHGLDGSLTSLTKSGFGQTIDAMKNLGISSETANSALGSIMKNTKSMGAIQNFKLFETGEDEKKISGLSGAILYAKATGQEFYEVGQQLAVMTRELGVESKDTGKNFDSFARAAADSGRTVGEVSATILEQSKNFESFGNNIDGVTVIYDKFLRAFGPGRTGIATKAFEAINAGISRMPFGLKAFIGEVSGMGAGRGAVASGLKVEEAFETGKGLTEVVDAIKNQVESLSGAQLMTRKEAIASGQETTYMRQRNLTMQFSGVSEEMADSVMRGLQGGMGSIEQLQSTIQGKRPSLVVGAGQERINQEEGVAGLLRNQLDLARITNSSIVSGNAKLITSFDGVAGAARDVGKSITGKMLSTRGTKDLLATSDAKDKMIKQTQESAGVKAHKAEQATSAVGVAAAVGAVSTQVNLQDARTMDRTGAVSSDVPFGIQNILNATGIKNQQPKMPELVRPNTNSMASNYTASFNDGLHRKMDQLSRAPGVLDAAEAQNNPSPNAGGAAEPQRVQVEVSLKSNMLDAQITDVLTKADQRRKAGASGFSDSAQ